jgi:formylglycine-generating enzyme required for sulfatase activity
VALEVVEIPAGMGVMGPGNRFFSEAPPHPVRIAAPFLLGRHLVTQAQWEAVMGANPSRFRDPPDLPVDSVSWDDAEAFCGRLSALTGRRCRLPTETEWEYACRAGTTGDFFFGAWGPYADDTAIPRAVRLALAEHAWFDEDSAERSHPVGRKRANPWGLHDMVGNLWEWCAASWHDDYVGAPVDGSAWRHPGDTDPRRVLRGGAWAMNAFRCRSSYRSDDHRSVATSRFGVQVVVEGA